MITDDQIEESCSIGLKRKTPPLAFKKSKHRPINPNKYIEIFRLDILLNYMQINLKQTYSEYCDNLQCSI